MTKSIDAAFNYLNYSMLHVDTAYFTYNCFDS